jgi:hypothetical protein
MRVQDRDIDHAAAVAQETIVFTRDQVPANQTGLLLGSFVPGYGFEIISVQHLASAVGGTTKTVDVKIGAASALLAAVTPVAATRTTASLAAAGSARTGSTTSAINIHGTTSARAIGAVTAGANTGNGAPGAATLGAAAEIGTYQLRCITAAANGGVFSVITPSGVRLKDLTVAVAYATDHINLTIADGATDFIVGDSFTVAVTEGGKIDDLQVAVTIKPTGLRA